MNIIVCIKQTPDTEALIRIDSEDKTKISEKDLKFIINPYDEYAIEEALQIKENLTDTTITAITIGPERAKEALKDAIAMGVDEVIHIWDDGLDDLDPFTTAEILAEVIRNMDYDLILCGKQAIDDDSLQVPAIIADRLNLPQILSITDLNIDKGENKITAEQEIDGGARVVEAKLPAVISCQKGLNEPRYPSMRGKMKAKKMDIPMKTLQDLGIQRDTISGLAKKRFQIKQLSYPPSRSAGEILKGEPEEVIEILISKLKDKKVL